MRMEQPSLFEERSKKIMQEELNKALPSIPTVAKASVRIASECDPNEVHLVVPRGNIIISDAVQSAMRLQGKNVKRVVLPVTQVGTYQPGEIEDIIRLKLSKLPLNSTVHYIDECNTGDNSVQISKALKKIAGEKKFNLKIDLIANNGGLNITRSNRRKLEELKAVIHPVSEIPWMDRPIIEGYVWSKNLMNVSNFLKGVNKKNAKKVNKMFNSIMFKKYDWVRDKKRRNLKIMRYDSPEYLKRPFQVLSALYEAFKKTGLDKKYKVWLNRREQVIYINNEPMRAAQLFERREPIDVFTQKEDQNKEIDKYTLLRIGSPYSRATIEYRRRLAEEIKKMVKR